MFYKVKGLHVLYNNMRNVIFHIDYCFVAFFFCQNFQLSINVRKKKIIIIMQITDNISYIP